MQVTEASIESQPMWGGVDSKVGEAALDDMPLLDAGKNVAQEVVLTVEREPIVDEPRRPEQRRHRSRAQLVIGFGLCEDDLRVVSPGVRSPGPVAARTQRLR